MYILRGRNMEKKSHVPCIENMMQKARGIFFKGFLKEVNIMHEYLQKPIMIHLGSI